MSLWPDFIVYCVVQLSYDLAKDRFFDDFDVNVGCTLILFEVVWRVCSELLFIFMSMNKVYGDVFNWFPLVELEIWFDFVDLVYKDGVIEDCFVDHCLYSLFGVSKLVVDVMV